MASSITVKIIRNDLGRLESRIRTTSADMSEETADEIVKDARQRVPKVTRTLERSIDKRQEGIGYLVEATAPYAGFVEYGTRNMAAQPYLTPAAEAQRAPFLGRLKRALGSM